MSTTPLLNLHEYVRCIPDFPKPGIMFRDITPLLSHPAAFRETIGRMADHFRGRNITAIAAAEARGDPVGTTVWGRVPEQIRKLALLYAVSARHQTPRIDAEAVRWASDFVLHQTRRMLFMAQSHVAENPFHADCLKLFRKLREAPDQQMQRQHLLRAMRCKAADFDQMIITLVQQGDIVPVTIQTRTKTAQGYRLA